MEWLIFQLTNVSRSNQLNLNLYVIKHAGLHIAVCKDTVNVIITSTEARAGAVPNTVNLKKSLKHSGNEKKSKSFQKSDE